MYNWIKQLLLCRATDIKKKNPEIQNIGNLTPRTGCACGLWSRLWMVKYRHSQRGGWFWTFSGTQKKKKVKKKHPCMPFSSMCNSSAAVWASESISEAEAGMFRQLFLPTLKVPVKFPTVWAISLWQLPSPGLLPVIMRLERSIIQN